MAWSTRQTGIYTGEDDAGYLLLSDALRHGTYREWQWLGDPIANRFPPGYPALLMILRLLVPDGLLAATLLGIGFSLICVSQAMPIVRTGTLSRRCASAGPSRNTPAAADMPSRT